MSWRACSGVSGVISRRRTRGGSTSSVMGPGGYKFGDYWKLGLPIMGLLFAVSVFLVPVFWPF